MRMPWKHTENTVTVEDDERVTSARRCAEEACSSLARAIADEPRVRSAAQELRRLHAYNHFELMLTRALRENLR